MADEILPLIGSKEGIANMSLAWLDPGDLALVPDPGYPTYRMGAALAGADVYYMPLREENDYLPDLAAIPAEIADTARIMWLNYPNNPTGSIAPMSFFEAAVDFCRRHDILLCHDVPYADVCYDGYVAPSLLAVPGAKDVAVEFNSLSKSHNMAGWRVGMAVGNKRAVGALGADQDQYRQRHVPRCARCGDCGIDRRCGVDGRRGTQNTNTAGSVLRCCSRMIGAYAAINPAPAFICGRACRRGIPRRNARRRSSWKPA